MKSFSVNCGCNELNFVKIELTGNQLPDIIGTGVTHLLIDVNNMSEDLDISNYVPNGLVEGGVIRVRKIDESPFRIIHDDGIVSYNFIKTKGEYLWLVRLGGKTTV